jgi:hypothetical protein
MYTAPGVGSSETNIWSVPGEYEVKAQAKDIYDYESSWPDSLIISMPRNHENWFMNWFFNFILKVCK